MLLDIFGLAVSQLNLVEPGSYFESIRNQSNDSRFPGPNPFTVLELPVAMPVTERGINWYNRNHISRHLVLRQVDGGESVSSGPTISTWS
ncbi:MAG: hypothetical protein Q9226_008272 [Calogaya cf. arnoldii]